MSSERFWHLVSRKLANEAQVSELEELDMLIQGNDELKDLYENLTDATPLPTEEENIEAEQAFALHSIRLHLSDKKPESAESVKYQEEHSTQLNSAVTSVEDNEEEFNETPKRKRFLVPVLAFLVVALVAFSLYFYQAPDPSLSTFNTVVVPAGQRVKITLPDKSTVWLNSKSKLIYPAAFSKKERKVILEGEAFFDVVHNPEHPFSVSTPSHTINVLGTVFNVTAYKNSNSFRTTLVSGSVKVREASRPSLVATLKPGESFSYDKKKVSSSVIKVDTKQYTSWKEGLYQFNHLPFGEIVSRLGDYKGINIIVKDSSFLNISYTGKFRQDESIHEIMEVMKSDIHFQYNYDEKTNTLTID